jgi:phosphoglycerate dehydrogenase-like enzyme
VRESTLMETAYLFNVARGLIVDEKALNKAPKNGWIARAGVDICEKEPPDPENHSFKLENIVLTTYIAW